MRLGILKAVGAAVLWAGESWAVQMPAMNHGRMLMDTSGRVVMGQNTDLLPAGCRDISEDAKITVHAGHRYAKSFPGTIFGYSEHEWRVKPCARVTVTLVNDDQVRHQWMLHGLPEDLSPMGMFYLEVTGPGEVTGTFIVPAEDKTYLVHCDIAQHTQKGMKAQLVVGRGSGSLPSIPGISDPRVKDDYAAFGGQPPVRVLAEGPQAKPALFSGMLVLGFVAAVLGAPYLFNWMGARFFGMKGRDLSGYLFNRLTDLICLVVRALASVFRLFGLMKKATLSIQSIGSKTH